MNLRHEFADVAARHPDRPMAWWNGTELSYRAAVRHADALLPRLDAGRTLALVAGKSLGAYAAIWAAIRNGARYVPLNPDWNASRVLGVVERVAPALIACDAEWGEANRAALTGLGYSEGVPAPAIGDAPPLRLFEREGGEGDALARYEADAGVEDLAYVIFTSGSTGAPKGVPIHRAGIEHYIRRTRDALAVGEGERWLQTVQLTFDPSIHDMFLAWTTGGVALGMPPEQAPLGPRYVRRLEAQNWFAVPSSVGRALSLGLVKEGSMPSLRRSVFSGESLPRDLALTWTRAAPNGEVLNLYGPTETTMTFTLHRFDPEGDIDTVVPVGRPLPGCDLELVDGEIVHSGPQVFGGYLDNAEENAARLSVRPDGTRRFRTGDRGEMDADGVLHFRGRFDWQVKIRGHRVEMEEVVGALRAVSGKGVAAVVPVGEVTPGSYEDLHAFIERGGMTDGLKAGLAELLPSYMVPRHVTELSEFPFNANGKIDRAALARLAGDAA